MSGRKASGTEFSSEIFSSYNHLQSCENVTNDDRLTGFSEVKTLLKIYVSWITQLDNP